MSVRHDHVSHELLGRPNELRNGITLSLLVARSSAILPICLLAADQTAHRQPSTVKVT